MVGRRSDSGFSLVELMLVVLVLAILVSLALPIYVSATSQATKRTCFQNQRTLEGAVMTWAEMDEARETVDVVGPVDAANPIVADHIVGAVPRCPAADPPVDADHPTVGEGGYVFHANGTLEDCPHGRLGPHGHY